MTGPCQNFQLPAGVRDLLPGEAGARRQLEQKLMDFFQSWGYREVLTPTFEFIDTFKAGSRAEAEDSLYKFIDRYGRVLALRPEMTAPIARLAATRLGHEELPLRLCYSASVFRYEEPRANRLREFNQTGVELIGARGVAADAEIIALAVESLLEAGLKDFRLGLGQVAVTMGVLHDLELPEAKVARIKAALASKDLVALERLSEDYSLNERQRSSLQLLAGLHGGSEALDEARSYFGDTEAAAFLDELGAVWQALQAYGLEKWLFIDLSILRDFDYYTGIVFEGYVPGLGVPVCGGGRYDDLLAQFGRPCPATGFALGLERLLTALGEKFSCAGKQGYLIAGDELEILLNRARQLRRQGTRVILGQPGENQQQAEARAAAQGLTLLWLESGETICRTVC
ncbi:MAG: ATP phosphoribosyltransferase regulatory subunit [Clostridia bacterium]|nr:ATP phosphoribosyltransferase regulatory subunit [Clostridia bacterium]